MPDKKAIERPIKKLLISKLNEVIAEKEWSQREAARQLGTSQPRVNTLVHGKEEMFSLAALKKMCESAGLDVTVTIPKP